MISRARLPGCATRAAIALDVAAPHESQQDAARGATELADHAQPPARDCVVDGLRRHAEELGSLLDGDEVWHVRSVASALVGGKSRPLSGPRTAENAANDDDI